MIQSVMIMPRPILVMQAIGLSAGGVVLLTQLLPHFGVLRTVLSLCMDKCAHRYTGAKVIRSTFLELAFPVVKEVQAHSHGVAAATRNTASVFVDMFGGVLGLVPEYYQMSAADERHGRSGTRSWYWFKDTPATPRFGVGGRRIRSMIDVDYYVDMPYQLACQMEPVILYTLTPVTAGRICDNYSYTFVGNEVKFVLAGGATFQHPLWDYGVDVLIARRYFCGVLVSVTGYNVDRRLVAPDHSVVLLTPMVKFTGVAAWVASWTLKGAALGRFTPHDGDYTAFQLRSVDKHTVTIGRQGGYHSVVLPVDVNEGVRGLFAVAKHDVTIPSIEGMLSLEGDTPAAMSSRKRDACLLMEYHRRLAPPTGMVSYPVEYAVRRYQFGDYQPEAKPLLVAFMQPLFHGAFAPDVTLGNEQRAVQKRIIDVKSEAPMTPLLYTFVKEFVERFLPVAHCLLPVDDDEIYERQARPSQRRILQDAELEPAKRMIKSFIKREAYGKLADPRIISTICGPDKRAYSQYIYPLADHLKTMPWYAFALSPLDIAHRVVMVCEGANVVLKTDFSRFDGTISPCLRYFEMAVLARAFPTACLGALHDIHRAQYNLRAVCELGTSYPQGTARASGSLETAAFNSIDNAFSTYVTWRRTRAPDGAYYEANAAWAMLSRGLHGGDDGLVPDVDPVVYESSCRMLGLSVKAEPVVRGQLGVMFLARVYGPDVWHGDNNSCADLPRQLSKLHVSKPYPTTVSPAQRAYDKLLGFELSDPNTPVLGQYATLACKILRESGITEVVRSRWDAEVPIEKQYPNRKADWMLAYLHVAMPGYNYPQFCDWLSTVTTTEQVLRAPCCVAPPTPVAPEVVVLEDETLYPFPVAPSVAPQKAPVAPKTVRSKEWARRPTGKGQQGGGDQRGDGGVVGNPRRAKKNTVR